MYLYIPVVVHVVYYNIDEKISKTKVKSQIEVLNADFAHLIILGRFRKNLHNLIGCRHTILPNE